MMSQEIVRLSKIQPTSTDESGASATGSWPFRLLSAIDVYVCEPVCKREIGFKTVEYENSALITCEWVESGKNLWYALQWE